ncbi:hypothetical protein D9758_011145 [Tetrapyrgos nigripes]|uniref:NmrA-like domain-containing protein n=1 Tax=Tetrapyrgos nigripes TaxID=182062 RepID=A0A8H5CKP3_9AGAR|nr:hypothetical protein D9758_011145 [Tetrapyrgos nigripes]
MATLPTAIVFGGSGLTGSSIANALLERKEFQVKVPVRPSSLDKPSTVDLRQKGAIIIPFDLVGSTANELQELITGADTVISAIVWEQLHQQYKMVDVAKKVGVKRFVPCDFGTAGRRGVRKLHDLKLDIRDYVKASGIGYTFIDAGFWYQLLLMCTNEKQTSYPWLYEDSRYVWNGGLVKTAGIDLRDVGQFSARIVADPRTLNQYVFAWGLEVTQQELVKYARKYGDPNVEIFPKSTDDLRSFIAGAEDMRLVYCHYQHSMWILGENTIEKAKLPEFGGALDARELYPDMKIRPIGDYAREFYKK